MQRLTERSDRERGAVAVVVALLLVPLIGFAALAIDVASMWSQQQRLQVAADASALAIAQDCARESGTCVDSSQNTADQLTLANFGTGANEPNVTVDTSAGTVTVSPSTESHHLFAPILGFTSHEVGALSTASWGAPAGGPTILPITFSYSCLFNSGTNLPALGVKQVIYPYNPTMNAAGCSVPGGFGWIDTDPNQPGQCIVNSSVLDVLSSDPGKSMSNPCKAEFADLLYDPSQQDEPKVVLLPVFDHSTGTGTNATYTISGYAAFVLEGYSFPGAKTDNAKICANSNCLIGYFTQFVDLNDVFKFSTTAPDLGAELVKLTS